MAQQPQGKVFTEEEVDNDFFLNYINKKRRNVVKKMKQIRILEEQDPENLKPKQRVKLNNKAQVQQQIESFDSMRVYYGQAWTKSGKDTENNTQQHQQTVKTVVEEKVVEVVVQKPPNYSTVARVALMLSYLGQVKSQKVKDLGQGVFDLGENQVVSERLDEMTEELVEILKMGPEQLHSLTEFFTANELLTQNGSDLVRVPAPEVVETPEVVLQEQEEEQEPVVEKKEQSSFDSDSVEGEVEKEETPVVEQGDAQDGDGGEDAVDADEGMEMTVEKGGEKWAEMNSEGSDGEEEGKKSEGSEKNFEVRDDSNIEQVKKSKRTVQEPPKEDDVDEDGFKLVRKKPGKQTNNRGNRKYGKYNNRGKYGGNGNRNYKNRGNYRRRYNNDDNNENREDRVYQKNDKNNHYYKGDRGYNRRQDRNRNYNDRDDYKNTRGNRDNNRRNYKNRRYDDRDNSQEKKE